MTLKMQKSNSILQKTFLHKPPSESPNQYNSAMLFFNRKYQYSFIKSFVIGKASHTLKTEIFHGIIQSPYDIGRVLNTREMMGTNSFAKSWKCISPIVV